MSPKGAAELRLQSRSSRWSLRTSRSMPARTAWYCPSPGACHTISQHDGPVTARELVRWAGCQPGGRA
jgi:hypothetical protein